MSMKWTRRNFLFGSAAAVGALAVPGVFGARQAQAATGPKHLITVFASGGWDTTYALDPKPGVATVDSPTDGDVTMFGNLPIFTSDARPAVAGFFQKYGSLAAVINGIQVRAINHPDCSKRILTGTPSEANPDMGSIAAYELGRDRPAPYFVLGPSAVSGPFASIAARAGSANQIRTLLTPTAALPKAEPFTSSERYAPDQAEADLVKAFVQARAGRMKELRGKSGYNADRYDDFLSSLERRDVLRGFSDGFGDDFTFTLDIREQIKLGLEAIQRGVCWSVHLEQAFASWDTHTDNSGQNTMHQDMYDALTVLGDELAARPGSAGNKMLDETIVVVLSEMGRTPKLNAAMGKDHWPVTSALVFGAGIKGGNVFGATDAQLQAMNVDLHTGAAAPEGAQLQYGNLAAGILGLAGVDASPYLPESEAFDAFAA
jgi:hypothetical protein